MSSIAQKSANRRNSHQSTGPKTDQGKARSARNATKHGLRSTNPVIPEIESQEEWDTHRDVYVEDLHPVGPIETQLAEKEASLAWRIERAVKFETDMASLNIRNSVEEKLKNPILGDSDPAEEHDLPARLRSLALGDLANHPVVREILQTIDCHALPTGNLASLILRYTAALERDKARTHKELRERQRERLSLAALQPEISPQNSAQHLVPQEDPAKLASFGSGPEPALVPVLDPILEAASDPASDSVSKPETPQPGAVAVQSEAVELKLAPLGHQDPALALVQPSDVRIGLAEAETNRVEGMETGPNSNSVPVGLSKNAKRRLWRVEREVEEKRLLQEVLARASLPMGPMPIGD